MRRKRNKVNGKFYTLAWSLILVLSAYILLRFAVLSFSNDIGQANNVKDALLSKLCGNIMESGSSFVRYQGYDKEDYSFGVNLVYQGLLGGSFNNNQQSNLVKMQEETSLNLNNNYENVIDRDERDLETLSVISYHDITEGKLSKEYILTNGAMGYGTTGNEFIVAIEDEDTKNNLPIGYVDGDVHKIPVTIVEGQGSAVETLVNKGNTFTLEQLKDVNYFTDNFYIIDSTTKITNELFNAERLLAKDMKIEQDNGKPQILIYHTHSQEMYADSKGKENSIVAVGAYLEEILREDYGYNVIHDTTEYDIVNGVLDRNKAYNQAEVGLENVLKKNPSIEIIIDLHRDDGKPRVTYVNGKESAQIMLFQGLSMNQKGPIAYLNNPNLEGNLAFGLQLRMKSLELYPGLFYKTYLKCWRYNLHFREKSILVECGTDENSYQSALNAMEPLAKVLNQVLQGK